MCKDMNGIKNSVVENTKAAVSGFASSETFKNTANNEDALSKYIEEKFAQDPELRKREVIFGC